MEKIQSKKRRKKGRVRLALRLAAVCFGAILLFWLARGAVHLAGDNMRQQRQLDLAAAALENLALLSPGEYQSESIDPQMVFTGIDTGVRLVRLEADFGWDPKEMELFYARKQGQGFSPAKRVIGVPQSDGSYLYTLPAGQVHSLRMDLGTAGGNPIALRGITLNPRLPAWRYFVPTLRDGLLMLLWGALALCAVYTIIEYTAVARAFLRRKEAKQHG